MRKLYCFLVLLFFLFTGNFVLAQLVVTPCSAIGQTPQQFIQNQLVGQGVTISNATFNGSSAIITSGQLGSFIATNTAFTELGFSAGVLLTSGLAAGAVGPNNVCGTGATANTPGDPDLTAIAGVPTLDACVIEFDFVPVSDTLKFRYEFGSEEMYTYYMQFNDAFGFFLSGPGITGPFSNNSVDIALMPATINSYVTINNLCNDVMSSWCNSPVSCPFVPPHPHDLPPPAFVNCTNPRGSGQYLQYNGFSIILTAWHLVQPCQTYHIKLAIGDAMDRALDSGVFLEENSFSATGFTVNNTFAHPFLGSASIEGCSDATITFKLQAPTIENDTIRYTIGGTAINGVDYTHIPDSVIIPAGMDSTFIVITPFLDGITEGTETVILDIPMINCSGGTTYHDTVLILDNLLLTAELGIDTTLCLGQSVVLHALQSGGQSPLSYLWSTGSTLTQITVTPPAGANKYYVQITDGCGTVATDSVTVNVFDHPVVTNVNLVSTVCTGSTTNIIPQPSIPGSTFSWTASCSDPLISGYSGGSGLTITQSLMNTGLTTDTVIYHVTANFGGCMSVSPKDFKVAVIPSLPATFLPNGQSFCSGETTAISISSILPATTFPWTFTLGSPNLGGASNGAGNLISQTLFNSGFTIDTVTYHITPLNSGCPGILSNVKVAVYPNPDSWATPASQIVCSGNQTSLLLSSHVAGVTFTWTASGSSANVSGYSSGSGNVIAQNLTNSGFNIETVTYSVTPTTSGCTGGVTNIIVTVYPVANVLFTPNGQTICSASSTSIVLNSNAGGATFTWTATGVAGITGFGPGSGSTINQVLNNSGAGAGTATYTVTPTANACTGFPSGVTITVDPLAAVSFTPCTDIITTSDANPVLLKGGLPLGGNYSGAGVNAGLFNPALAGTGSHLITYTYNNVFGCPNTASLSINVLNPLPFFCNNPVTDVRDNQQYLTIQLGVQCWMAANLNFGSKILTNVMQRDNCLSEKYCLNDLTPNCTSFGGQYQWDEMMQFQAVQSTQGLCPPAWHVPSENEWNTLFNFYISSGFAGSPLKSSGYSGFNAFLKGTYFDNRNWYFDNFATFFWSSTTQGPFKAWAHGMNDNNPSVSYYPANRMDAFYVRCIKN